LQVDEHEFRFPVARRRIVNRGGKSAGTPAGVQVLIMMNRWCRKKRSTTGYKLRSLRDQERSSRATLAIVFTDVVGSTALEDEMKDDPMNELRRAHFQQSRKLIEENKGREIKTLGDSFMAAFRSVDKAVDYTLALQADPGHAKVQVRAGIHIGPVHVEENDVFGGAVNFAARVVHEIKGAEIWLSARAKEDLDGQRAKRHTHLKWQQHNGRTLKGFPGTFTLWSLQADERL
jgi:class 3 adenylate cyclase